MADSVYRVTEVIGVSSESWEAAARNAVETAAKTVRDLRVAEEGAVTVADMLERVIAETEADAAALGCSAEIGRCRTTIVSSGSAEPHTASSSIDHSTPSSRSSGIRPVRSRATPRAARPPGCRCLTWTTCRR